MVFERETGTVRLPSGQLIGLPKDEMGQELSNVIAKYAYECWQELEDK